MCFKTRLNDYLSVNDIKYSLMPITVETRKKFKICIIDDAGYPKDGFDKLGYVNVDVHTKAHKLEDYAKYQIILCDVQGVGTQFSPEEGLAFAKQLKQVLPGIEILLFTGQNVKNYGDSDDLEVLKKPKYKNELALKFDDCIKNLTNPVKLWGKLYKYFTTNNVSSKDLVILEDRFAKSFKKNSSFSLDGLWIATSFNKESAKYIAELVGTVAAAYTKELCL